jgi:hypothetical protein
MGRTIPSFRQLLEIERIEWSSFKKALPTKKEKQAFDEICENAKLYTSYLSNAVNPIVFESVMMGAVFHNYNTLLKISEENEEVNEDIIANETKLLAENNPHGKTLFDRTCEKWQGLIYALHMEDRQILLKMMLETCNYSECCGRVTNSEDSKSPVDYFFLLTAVLKHQKLINKINKNNGIEGSKNKTLVDFMHNQ